MTDENKRNEAVDVEQDMEARLDVGQLDWEEEVGDKIHGYLDSVEWPKGGKSGEPFPVATLLLKDGTLARIAHTSRANLAGQLEAKKAQPGDYIGIKYLGLAQSKSSGRDYHKYTVLVDHKGPRGDDVFKVNGAKEEEDDLVAGATDDVWNQTSTDDDDTEASD